MKKHVTCKCFENAASRAKTNVITTVHVTDDDISFYDGLGMLIRKTPYDGLGMLIGKTPVPCINSM